MTKEYNIVQKKSPNHFKGRKGWKPDMIVSHITEGNFNGAVSWLCNPKSIASSHFVVAQDGRITQLVSLEDGSWCNGTSVNPPTSKLDYRKSTLKNVKTRKTNANYYTVTIEHEGFSYEGQGRLTEAQLKATIWLHKHIIKEVKRIYDVDIPIDREHIVGHFEINPITKPNCPGKNFQFDEIIKELRKGVVDVAIENWQREMGEKALDSLNKKKDNKGNLIVDSPEKWKESLGENLPQWLFWSVVDRIAK